MEIINITQMEPGESGMVLEFSEYAGFSRKLRSMGLRPGRQIIKVSSHFWRGPQTIETDNIQLAIGFGMAKKIMVKVKRKSE